MQRSYNAGGAIGVTGILAFLIAQCTAPDPGPPIDSTAPPTSAVVTTLATAATTTTATGPEPTTTLAPSTTTIPAAPTTQATTTTAPTTTIPPTTTPPTTAPPTAPSTIPAATTPAATAPPTTATPAPPPTAAPTTAPAPPSTEAPPTTPAPPPPPPPTPGATPSPDAVSLTNQQRQAAGLPALSTSGALTAAAQQHSADQAGRDSMGHTGSDGSSAGDRIRANGGSFSTWAENVAAGYGSASAVVDGWMNSPGHRENILDPSMTQIGVAVATSADGTPYWTMVLSG